MGKEQLTEKDWKFINAAKKVVEDKSSFYGNLIIFGLMVAFQIVLFLKCTTTDEYCQYRAIGLGSLALLTIFFTIIFWRFKLKVWQIFQKLTDDKS